MEMRSCKKCLLRDMSEDEHFLDLEQYIARIDNDLKADSLLYEERLSKCSNCNNLISGMCTKCGCYVELRAVIKNNNCPDVPQKW